MSSRAGDRPPHSPSGVLRGPAEPGLAIDCPSPDQLVAFMGGELADERSVAIEGHMDECGECRAVLSNLARGGPPPTLGRYRIDTVLGSGGMGIVYRAFDPQLARPLAIKVVRRAGEDTTGRARLVREAQALARLSHPNVCHVYDVGTHDDEVWVAMELIDGVQLRQWASEGRTQDEIIECLLGAAHGIAAAHDAGLVHRDIKPENVLVTRDSRPIVTDFGLARHQDQIDPNASTVAPDPQLTQTGAIAGTPAYLAPEQLLGDPIDARVDQFAWAVMAWELITGNRPFPVVFAVRVEAVRAGLTPPTNLPHHIYEALARAMSASPSDRFPSMRELIAEIKAGMSSVNTGTARARAVTAPILPAKGRAAALAGIAVLGASAIAVVAWSLTKDSKAAPAAAPIVAAQPTPTPQPEAQPAPIPTAPTPAPAPAPEIKAEAAPPPAPAPDHPKAESKAGVAVATKAKAPPTAVGKKADSAADSTAAPAPPQPQISTTEPQGPITTVPAAPQPARPRYCRSCQIAVADSFCRIPTDFANTGYPKNWGVLDWGVVTKVEDESGTFRDETIHETVITMRGQRKTYRFTAEFLDTYVSTQVGASLAICPEDQNDLYKLSGGPTDLTRAVITMSGAPKTLVAAKLGAKHISDLSLAAASLNKRFDNRVTEDGRYLIHAKIYGIDGPRYRMDRYWMKVPKGMKGEDKLDTNKLVWLVVEAPEFVEIEGKETLVVTAAAILDDIFPQ